MKTKYRYAVERRYKGKKNWVVDAYVDGWKGCEKEFLKDIEDYNSEKSGYRKDYQWRLCRVTEVRTPVRKAKK